MLLYKSKDKLTCRKFGQVVYLCCCTFCIFLETIKQRTSSALSFSLYVSPERRKSFRRALLSPPTVTKTMRALVQSTHGYFLPCHPYTNMAPKHYLVSWGKAPPWEGRQAEGCDGCCDDCCWCMRSCRLRAFRILICNFLSTRALLCVLELAPCRASLSLEIASLQRAKAAAQSPFCSRCSDSSNTESASCRDRSKPSLLPERASTFHFHYNSFQLLLHTVISL